MLAQPTRFNEAQKAVLNVMSCLQSEEDLADLKRTLVKFMNERLQREMDKLWDSGEWSEEKIMTSDDFVQKADEEMNRMWDEGILSEERIESFRHLHERTPYN